MKSRFFEFCKLKDFDKYITVVFLFFIYITKLEEQNKKSLTEFLKVEKTITEWEFLFDCLNDNVAIIFESMKEFNDFQNNL